MNAEVIASIAIEAVQIISIIVGIFFIKKKGKVDDLAKIIEAIPIYIAEANAQIPNATIAVKISYILAEIKEDCAELGIKYKEKRIKTKIEEGLNEQTHNAKECWSKSFQKNSSKNQKNQCRT